MKRYVGWRNARACYGQLDAAVLVGVLPWYAGLALKHELITSAPNREFSEEHLAFRG
jgi:hypothetical protein